jgi:DegV family protein with EDD domain
VTGVNGRVAVVTDSTACLSAALVGLGGITVVPLDVVMAGRARPETDIDERELVAALRGREKVTTSRPTPDRFAQVFTRLADEGAAAVLSVHLSAAPSGPCEAARLAADRAPVPVEIYDSAQMSFGVGCVALAAARAAHAGADRHGVLEAARQASTATRVLFCVDDLEHLRRGGRIGSAAALIGSALAVKPILHVVDGRVAVLEKARTATRARARLVEVTLERMAELTGAIDACGARMSVTVQHLGAETAASGLAEVLAARTGVAEVPVLPVGAVVGAHVGPGAVGVVIGPA